MKAKIAKTWNITKKYFDKIVSGDKEVDFRINKPDYDIEKGDVVIFKCGEEEINCVVTSIDTSSGNLADAVYGAYIWGGQTLKDSVFEYAYGIYEDLKKFYKDQKDEIRKHGVLVVGIEKIKKEDLQDYLESEK